MCVEHFLYARLSFKSLTCNISFNSNENPVLYAVPTLASIHKRSLKHRELMWVVQDYTAQGRQNWEQKTVYPENMPLNFIPHCLLAM